MNNNKIKHRTDNKEEGWSKGEFNFFQRVVYSIFKSVKWHGEEVDCNCFALRQQQSNVNDN
jgi:hypothetical protein